MRDLYSQLRYYTEEVWGFQLIVRVEFDAVDSPLAPCMLSHFLGENNYAILFVSLV